MQSSKLKLRMDAMAHEKLNSSTNTGEPQPAHTLGQHTHTHTRSVTRATHPRALPGAVCISYQGRTVPAGCLKGGGAYGRAGFFGP